MAQVAEMAYQQLLKMVLTGSKWHIAAVEQSPSGKIGYSCAHCFNLFTLWIHLLPRNSFLFTSEHFSLVTVSVGMQGNPLRTALRSCWEVHTVPLPGLACPRLLESKPRLSGAYQDPNSPTRVTKKCKQTNVCWLYIATKTKFLREILVQQEQDLIQILCDLG